MTAWHEISRENVFSGYGRRNVDRITYDLPDGGRSDFDIKVEPDVVSVLALTTSQRFLTIKQFRPGPMMELDELPGGMHDGGGTPMDAAGRELKEETGYTAGRLTLLAKFPQDAYNTRFKWGYLALECQKTNEQDLEPTEFGIVNEWEPNNFIELATSGQMTDTEVALLGLVRLGLFTPMNSR